MMKLGGRCNVQKSELDRIRILGSYPLHAPLGAHPQKCDVGLCCWESQRRLSSSYIKMCCASHNRVKYRVSLLQILQSSIQVVTPNEGVKNRGTPLSEAIILSVCHDKSEMVRDRTQVAVIHYREVACGLSISIKICDLE